MNEQISHALQSFEKYWNGKANAHWTSVFERAHEIFVGAGFEWDFCLQSASGSVVFGGSNRLIWDRSTSKFRVSPAHCSDEFIAHAERVL